MFKSHLFKAVSVIILVGAQASSTFAASSGRRHLPSTIGAEFGASGSQAVENPLADRAATLGGQAFTIERAEGSSYKAAAARSSVAGDNPLRDRATTLGGDAFTVERAEGRPYRASTVASDAASDALAGNPLKDRAETLGGRTFAVESGVDQAGKPRSFLARFQ